MAVDRARAETPVGPLFCTRERSSGSTTYAGFERGPVPRAFFLADRWRALERGGGELVAWGPRHQRGARPREVPRAFSPRGRRSRP